MLHGLKVALSGRGDKSLLATDQRLSEADETVTELQRWFPQLQVSVEENEKTWSILGHSIRTVSNHAREIYAADHDMQYMLDHLHAAGGQVVKPSHEHALAGERGRASDELRSFNERIREVRVLQTGCVAALKEKEYYVTKVEALRVNESRKKKVTERDVEKRLRNEQKLAEVDSELRFKWERLQRALESVELRKEAVLELVVWSFVQTQDYFFGRNPMGPVLALLGNRKHSPTGVGEVPVFDAEGADVCRSASAPPAEVAATEELEQPPRAPSPDKVLAPIGGALYPQI